jgi:hypothetical protein
MVKKQNKDCVGCCLVWEFGVPYWGDGILGGPKAPEVAICTQCFLKLSKLDLSRLNRTGKKKKVRGS